MIDQAKKAQEKVDQAAVVAAAAAATALEKAMGATDSEAETVGETAEVFVTTKKSNLPNDKIKALDRSMIALWILVTYVGGLSIIFFFVFFEYYGVLWDKVCVNDEININICTVEELDAFLDKPLNYLLEILKIAILPIMTLVIGFYFGSEKVNATNPQDES